MHQYHALAPMQAAGYHALHGSTGRQKSWSLANHSWIRYEAQEALQASQGSPGGSEAILAHASAILEAFSWQGQTAESQFRPMLYHGALYHVPRTAPATTFGKIEEQE